MSARSKQPTAKGPPPAPKTDEQKTTVFDSGNFKKEASTPIRAISMKTPIEDGVQRPAPAAPVLPQVQLRALAEVRAKTQPQNLGNLAPPYDASEARARSLREYVIWGCLAVILASAIALGVWFLAR